MTEVAVAHLSAHRNRTFLLVLVFKVTPDLPVMSNADENTELSRCGSLAANLQHTHTAAKFELESSSVFREL